MQANTALLQEISRDACRFLYSRYELDEIANGNDTVMYVDGDSLFLAIHIRRDRFDFVIILGDAERRALEERPNEFPKNVLTVYNDMKLWNDGKWIEIPVSDFEALEAVKRLLLMKKKPNRSPFPTETALQSKCGVPCDLCVHYTGGGRSEDFQQELQRRVGSVFGYEDFGENMMRCLGCVNKDCSDCRQLDHARSKGLGSCLACESYPCHHCGVVNVDIQAKRSTCAKTVTWAILPYVGGIHHGRDKHVREAEE